MEGIVVEPEAFASIASFFGGVALLAVVAAIALLGYMAGEEKGGKRLFWAEWPIPEAATPAPPEEIREAA